MIAPSLSALAAIPVSVRPPLAQHHPVEMGLDPPGRAGACRLARRLRLPVAVAEFGRGVDAAAAQRGHPRRPGPAGEAQVAADVGRLAQPEAVEMHASALAARRTATRPATAMPSPSMRIRSMPVIRSWSSTMCSSPLAGWPAGLRKFSRGTASTARPKSPRTSDLAAAVAAGLPSYAWSAAGPSSMPPVSSPAAPSWPAVAVAGSAHLLQSPAPGRRRGSRARPGAATGCRQQRRAVQLQPVVARLEVEVPPVEVASGGDPRRGAGRSACRRPGCARRPSTPCPPAAAG